MTAASATTVAERPPAPVLKQPKARSSRWGLARYLLLRLVLIIPTVWILITLVFFLMRVTGDPITAMLGGRASPQQIAERKHAAGFDRPILIQYWDYLWGVIHGNFGTAISDNQPISQVVATYGAATLELVVYSLIIAFLVGIPLGRWAARRYNKGLDVGIRSFAVIIYAAPIFFTAIVLKLIFSVWLGWLPASGRASIATQAYIESISPHTGIYFIDAILSGNPAYLLDVLQHALLPALALGLMTAGVFIRLIRINLLQSMRTDYVTAARARGVKEGTVVRKHAFRNALIPVVTVMGMEIAMMLGGAILTETSFEWQGLGYKLSLYLQARDFVAVQGIATVIAIIVAVASFIIDIVNALVDPRVRYE